MKILKIKNYKFGSKKAIIVEEVVRMVIAVACIFLLIYLGYKLYGIFTRGNEIEQVREVLGALNGKFNALENSDSVHYLLYLPTGWVLIALPDDKNSYNTLCICPKENDFSTQKNTCEKQGVCNKLKYEIKIESKCAQIGNPIFAVNIRSMPILVTPYFFDISDCYTHPTLVSDIVLVKKNGKGTIMPQVFYKLEQAINEISKSNVAKNEIINFAGNPSVALGDSAREEIKKIAPSDTFYGWILEIHTEDKTIFLNSDKSGHWGSGVSFGATPFSIVYSLQEDAPRVEGVIKPFSLTKEYKLVFNKLLKEERTSTKSVLFKTIAPGGVKGFEEKSGDQNLYAAYKGDML